MHKPEPKSKAVTDMLDTFFNRSTSILNSQCTNTQCAEPNLNFKNEISQREYTLSGLCQNCQDDVFGKDE
jgi:hypothetical protein